MAVICILKEVADSLRQALTKGDLKIDIESMYKMTSKERRALFAPFVDTETAKFINSKFENAMKSSNEKALENWAKSVFTAQEKKSGKYQDVLKKIEKLKELDVLDPENNDAFLEDLAATKLGATITADEAQKISEISGRLQEESGKLSKFGTPTKEYFKVRHEMDNYLASLVPSSRLKVATSVIARGTLLFSFKSPFLNVESNTIQGAIQAAQRRFETKTLGGVNNDFAIEYMKFVNDVYKDTGYDVSRMLTLDADPKIKGEETTTTQGPGKVRAVGRFYEDLIFKKTQGAPDVAFSSFAFADRANLESTKIAQGMGLKGAELKAKAREIFNDATAVEPKTEEGQAVRASAIADATYSTYTNKSGYSDFALGIRKLFNMASGDLRIGDQIMPFVKTPANVAGAGIDASGVFIPVKTAMRTAEMLKKIKAGEPLKEAFKEAFDGFAREIIRSGLGMTFAYLVSSLFKPDDFIGEYPVSQKERELLLAKRATTNSVKIGNRWVSVDYFGPLGAPIVGMLYAKKYGKDLPNTVWEYYKGIGRQAIKIPGFEEFYSTVEAIKQAAPGAGKTVSEEVADVANYMISFVRARTIPALVSDIAKGTDTVERKAPSKDALSQIKSGIPGLRQTLPEKKDVFGETVTSEGIMSVLLFGARVKTAKDDPLVNELDRLAKTDNLPSITDVEKTSQRAKDLKVQIGDDKFSEAKIEYGSMLKKRLDSFIKSETYKKANDERKKSMIEKIKDSEVNRMLRKFGYKKPNKST